VHRKAEEGAVCVSRSQEQARPFDAGPLDLPRPAEGKRKTRGKGVYSFLEECLARSEDLEKQGTICAALEEIRPLRDREREREKLSSLRHSVLLPVEGVSLPAAMLACRQIPGARVDCPL
jgi:hypothetical protein